eukprot:scaffold50785_cov63-Phaeocystis_antarctica.AAC.4
MYRGTTGAHAGDLGGSGEGGDRPAVRAARRARGDARGGAHLPQVRVRKGERVVRGRFRGTPRHPCPTHLPQLRALGRPRRAGARATCDTEAVEGGSVSKYAWCSTQEPPATRRLWKVVSQ